MRGAWSLTLCAVAACAAHPAHPALPASLASLPDAAAEITALLARSAADWNRGDLAGFMSDYARDSLTSYVSGGHVQYGWQKLFERYQATYFAPGKTRDSLSFEEVRVRSLAPDLAFCTARFTLVRGEAVTASGPFTLVLQKRNGRWLIVHDHTSADTK